MRCMSCHNRCFSSECVRVVDADPPSPLRHGQSDHHRSLKGYYYYCYKFSERTCYGHLRTIVKQ